MLAQIFFILAALFFAIFILTRKKVPKPSAKSQRTKEKMPSRVVQKRYGPLRIFFGSQTGTAAKLAEQLAEEAAEHGFEGEVIDLKKASIGHFERKNQISVFLLSNTGQGDPPENAVRWMKILRGKENLDAVKVVDWPQVNFTVFGLGNTQYEHYNTTGIGCDELLGKLGANRVHKLGLGDDNCSLEDDYTEWRKQLWPTLKKFRAARPLAVNVNETVHRKRSSDANPSLQYISKGEPVFANYKIVLKKDATSAQKIQQENLDFKTKASLAAQKALVKNIRELRQNQEDGSTLELEVQIEGQPDYQTAGNIALYAKNDPILVKAVVDHFGIKQADLDRKIELFRINEAKQFKLNFIPNTLRSLLEQSIDLQGPITKSILKKLAKFESGNKQYFTDNSWPKTTEQYKRITKAAQGDDWYYLFRLVKEHNVKLILEDFVELSDSMAPRLFTIASYAKKQKNVIVAASIVDNGLISKFFISHPNGMKAELLKSTFTDAMKWKKVIFVAAGTGLAPFRAYLQEKEQRLRQKSEGQTVPTVSLFFGCKHEVGDFIYKDEILGWRDAGIIDRLYLAFSRDSAKKVYVQNLLEAEEMQLKELGLSEQSALYICGSLAMGNSIIEVLTRAFGSERVKEMQSQGRIVKELW